MESVFKFKNESLQSVLKERGNENKILKIIWFHLIILFSTLSRYLKITI